jgi:type II secretory pathway pseudopilin PulG
MKNRGFTVAELMVAMGISTAVIGMALSFLVYQSRYSSETIFTMKAQKLIYNVLMDIRLELLQAGPFDPLHPESSFQFTGGADTSELKIRKNMIPNSITYLWQKNTSTLYKNGKAILGPEVEVDVVGGTPVLQPVMGKTFKVDGFTRDTSNPLWTSSLCVMKLDYSWKVRSYNENTGSESIQVNIPSYQITEMIVDPDHWNFSIGQYSSYAIKTLIVGGK